MKFNVSEKNGELNFQVIWISIDGRLQTLCYQKYKEALKQWFWLKNLGREPSINVRLIQPKVGCERSELKMKEIDLKKKKKLKKKYPDKNKKDLLIK